MATKIIATIGPASEDIEIMSKMYEAGMRIARINLKYGSFEQYKKVHRNVGQFKECKLLFDIKELDKLEKIKGFDFDYLAISFAESVEQVEKIKDLMLPNKPKVISKIETQKGFENLDALISASDGIMVARGDLGKNISFEKVPIMQKLIIKKCNEAGKMVITATEMLLSMTDSKTPERAEASDIANAILDGSDYIMLSEETAIGKYPILAIETMKKVIDETEKDRDLLNT